MPEEETTTEVSAEEPKKETKQAAAEASAEPKKDAKQATAEAEKPAKKAPAAKKESKSSLSKDDIVAAIKEMSVLDLSDLIKTLEEELGVSAAPVMAVPAGAAMPGAAPAAGAAGGPEAEGEEQTEFSVILKDIGPNKIQVIKTVRELTTLGLKEAKELVESAPKAVREGVNKAEVASLKEKLEAVGATVEIQ